MSAIYRVVLRMHDRDDQSLIMPSLHYQTDLDALSSEPNPDDVASGAWGVWGTALKNAVNTNVHIDGIDAIEQTVPPAIGESGTFNVNADGLLGVSDDELPREVVPIINLKTHTRSRSSRGYLTLPGPYSVARLLNKSWATTYVTALQTFADLLDNSFDLGVVNPTTVNPVVYSRKRHLGGASPWTFRVTQATANTRPHWRRSRGTSP